MFLIPIIILLLNYIWISVVLFIICMFINFPKSTDSFLSDNFGKITFIISIVFTYYNFVSIGNLIIKIKEMIF